MSSASATAHVLVVDDDPEIRSLLAHYLGQAGYRTSTAADGGGMWPVLEREPVDVVVLDLMLPGDDGLALCRALRARSDLPVIMLTARGQAVDRVVGLEMGADDYMAKPFDPRELLARIRAVLRRSGAAAAASPAEGREPRWLRFAGWQLDTRARQVHAADGRVVSLGGADYRLLRTLLHHPHRPLGRDLLQEAVYGRERGPDDRAIDVCISRLRSRLEEDARQPALIRTLRNEGYQFAADVDGHD